MLLLLEYLSASQLCWHARYTQGIFTTFCAMLNWANSFIWFLAIPEMFNNVHLFQCSPNQQSPVAHQAANDYLLVSLQLSICWMRTIPPIRCKAFFKKKNSCRILASWHIQPIHTMKFYLRLMLGIVQQRVNHFQCSSKQLRSHTKPSIIFLISLKCQSPQYTLQKTQGIDYIQLLTEI